jgi:hypothetical protein
MGLKQKLRTWPHRHKNIFEELWYNNPLFAHYPTKSTDPQLAPPSDKSCQQTNRYTLGFSMNNYMFIA